MKLSIEEIKTIRAELEREAEEWDRLGAENPLMLHEFQSELEFLEDSLDHTWDEEAVGLGGQCPNLDWYDWNCE